MQIKPHRTTAMIVLAITTSLGAAETSACSLPSLTNHSASAWEALALPMQVEAVQASPTAAHAPPPLVDIVGMWKFTYVADGNGAAGPPDGVVIDAGYQTWHSDGTEITNSSRAPATGSFCQGVWAQNSWYSYRLNHWALSWDFDPVSGKPTVFVGPTNIRETVVMDLSGNKFDGTFTITQYAPDGTTVLGGVRGNMTAVRITAD